MQIPKELKIEEAVRRMKALGIIDYAIEQFKEYGVVMVSEPPFGALFTINEEQKKLVEEFEKEYNAVVYMIIRCYSTIGEMDSFLYVSDYEDEWGMDNFDIDDGYPMTYTYNYDMPDCSEFGSIGVQQRNGGLVRTA